MSETVQTSRDSNGETVIAFSGPLDRITAHTEWSRVVTDAKSARGTLVLDLSRMTTCDGIGVGLLAAADLATTAEIRVEGASTELLELLKMARLDGGAEPAERQRNGFISMVGTASRSLLTSLRDLIVFTGDVAASLIPAMRTLNATRIGEILRNCTRVGANAVPVVGFLGLLIGYILSVQAANAMENIGATSLVPMVVGFSVFREFGALIAGIILAGRTGSAFAAELGTMKVTEEMDAYKTFALDPMVVLVFPRILACVLVMPLLTLFSIVMAILGGALPLLAMGWGLSTYVEAVFDSVSTPDLFQAMVKSVVFGVIIAMLGCFHGMRTGSGADAVGASTTKAVVAGIVALLIADSLVSTIFYTLGI